MALEGKSLAYHQHLSVIIDDKKYELESIDVTNALLMLADYKARLMKDHHGAGTYDFLANLRISLPGQENKAIFGGGAIGITRKDSV